MRRIWIGLSWVFASIVCCASLRAQTPRLYWLGTFGGGYSLGRSISADGSTVVGWFGGSYASDQRAARWKTGERPVAIPHLGGGESRAYDVSADGNVVVGYSSDRNGVWRAFRWTPDSGTVVLDAANRESTAYGVSADGEVIVGAMRDRRIGSPARAFRWTAASGMQDIHTLNTPSQSNAYDVSADGRVVVGACITSDNRYRAFRWTPASGMQLIHPAESSESVARAISADGNTIVGYYLNARGDYQACYWDADGALHDIPVPANFRYSAAWGASADGSVIVGEVRASFSGESRAFRWHRASGVFELLGDFGGGQSVAYAASADGQTLCGWAQAPDRSRLAFRWRADTGLVNLGALGASSSVAYDVSADGRTVVGVASNTVSSERAFQWNPEVGLQPLPTPPFNTQSAAYSVSADGSVVVGYTCRPLGYALPPIATLWSGSTFQTLDAFDRDSEAVKVSADGTVLIGWFRNTQGYQRPFRWNAQEGVVNLAPPQWDAQSFDIRAVAISANGQVVIGNLLNAASYQVFRWTPLAGFEVIPPDPSYSNALAYGISPDGRFMVGFMFHPTTRERRAFLWSESTGYRNLGTLQNLLSEAYAVSAEGRVVVGQIRDSSSSYRRAFIWTEAEGMQDLSNRYAALLSEGSYFDSATAITPDGRYIVGSGFNADNQRFEAFLLDTGCPVRGDVNRDGRVDDADLLALLFAFGSVGYRSEDVNWDGMIDDADLLELLFNFGGGC